MNKDYEQGYRDGLWYGKVNTYGNLVIEAFQTNNILPGYTIAELMKIAIEHKKNEIKKLLTTEEVYYETIKSIRNKLAFSLVRLGDGEGIALGQGYCKSEEELLKYDFLEYTGISVPDYKARDELAEAVKNANIVGIPTNLMPDFQPLVCKALMYNNINMADLTICSANINQYLFQDKYFSKLLKEENIQVAIVGNQAEKLAEILQDYCQISGIISPVNGVRAVPQVLSSLHNFNFNLLLVAAGIPAVIICSKAAVEFNCTALDIGHLANQITKHKNLDFELF